MSIDADDMEYCEGTKEQPHPGVWFYRPEREIAADDFHYKMVRVGHCSVCVVLQHVVPVMTVETIEADGYGGIENDRGKLEVKA